MLRDGQTSSMTMKSSKNSTTELWPWQYGMGCLPIRSIVDDITEIVTEK